MPNSEEITEIRLQLGRIVSHIESESTNRERTHAALTALNKCLFGDGEKNGLIAKVNQLLEEHAYRKKMQAGIMATVIGLAVKAAWDVLSKHP